MLDQDAKSVEAGDDEEAEPAPRPGHEVLHGGADAVAGPILGYGVAQVGVQAAPPPDLGLGRMQAAASPSPPIPGRNAARLGVEIAAAVRPLDVVEEHNRERPGGRPARRVQQPKLTKDRVPVVVTVDQDRVAPAELREGGQARPSVTHSRPRCRRSQARTSNAGSGSTTWTIARWRRAKADVRYAGRRRSPRINSRARTAASTGAMTPPQNGARLIAIGPGPAAGGRWRGRARPSAAAPAPSYSARG